MEAIAQRYWTVTASSRQNIGRPNQSHQAATRAGGLIMNRTDAAPRPHVVILGAGFGGLSAAAALANSPFDVTLVDQHNYHLFQPLLYQVATAGLSPADIASPIRSIMRDARNVSVVLAKVSGIDAERREVAAEGRRIAFDHLIVATGAQHA
jgi:NADH:ubiquinone reductase (H+-translocating)